jgi:ATP-dependent DNA ligase
MAFDLLYHDRRGLLEDVVAGSESVFPVRRLARDGLETWNQVVERGYEGYMAQDEASAYEGGATRRWLKVNRRRGSLAARLRPVCAGLP